MKRAIWSICLLGIWASFFCAGPEGPKTAKGQVQGKAGKSDFVAGYIASEKKGYIARPCGFDMNRNGILGEPADRLVGDGKTADPDGDGVAEDILYVDAVAGSDDSGDGSTAKPFKTIQKAIDSADGPADGAEDIICISGVFHEALTLKKGGVPGHYAHDGFEFPSNPVMIVGWDKDGDGEYPPYDKDDVAVLDGKNGQIELAINNKPHGVGYWEMAHLTMRNYGDSGRHPRPNGGICLRGKSKADAQSHIYVHDVEFRGIAKGAESESFVLVISFFPAKAGAQTPPLRHVAFINNLFHEYGSYAFRGGVHHGGPFRFQNNSLKMHGPEGDKLKLAFRAYESGWKLWGRITGIEVLDNVVDGNPAAWGAKAYAAGIGACGGTQDWTIRGNVLIDLWSNIYMQADAGAPYIQDTPVDKVVIDRNLICNTYEGWTYQPRAITISSGLPGSPVTAIVKDVTITNNFISSTTGFDSGILCGGGNYAGPHPGKITIAGNTIVGPFGPFGFSVAQHGIAVWTESKFRPQNFVIKNNIITNTYQGKRNLGVNYAPTGWIAAGNVYDGASAFIWDKRIIGLDEWKKATGQDAGSKYAKPTFVDAAGGDLHLAPGDKSVAGVGVDITDITRVDFDGEPRSAENPTAGADAPRR